MKLTLKDYLAITPFLFIAILAIVLLVFSFFIIGLAMINALGWYSFLVPLFVAWIVWAGSYAQNNF